MYRKRSQSWLKHLDFMVIDLLCMQAALLFAYFIRHGLVNPYTVPIYKDSSFWRSSICASPYFSSPIRTS